MGASELPSVESLTIAGKCCEDDTRPLITDAMIRAGASVLGPWHFLGGDDCVSDESIVREIFTAMLNAANASPRIS